MMNKEGFEFSFTWLFALIAGAAILFIAIYTSGRILDTSQYEQSSETASRLVTIFDPLGVASSAESKSGIIALDSEIRITSDCYTDGSFGRQKFYVSEKKSFSDSYGDRGIGTETSNKYIFPGASLEGRSYRYFTKSMNMPFRVADMIVIIPEKTYCFVNAPEFIIEELEQLGMTNVITKTSLGGCKQNVTSITRQEIACFGSAQNSECGIKITDTPGAGPEYTTGYVESGQGRKYFFSSMIWPAIFSENKDYECNVKRMMMRTSALANVYSQKAKLLSARGVCETNTAGLTILASSARGLVSSSDIYMVRNSLEGIDENNACELW
jgi:hypothetical protein